MHIEKPKGSNRFTRSSRLLNARDFRTVFEHTEFRVAHPNFLLLATANKLDHSRIGLVVAKKNIRLAVNRNRVKRVVRETFRLWGRGDSPVDVIFLARKGIDTLSPSEQTKILIQGWHRLAKKVVVGLEQER